MFRGGWNEYTVFVTEAGGMETEEQVCEWESAVSVLSKPRQVMHVLTFKQLRLNSSFTPQIRKSSTQGFICKRTNKTKDVGDRQVFRNALNPILRMGMEQ